MGTTSKAIPGLDVEKAVRERYSAAAAQLENKLCCPVDYDRQYLAAIPDEVLTRDYGCGDPSRHVNAGEVVLDLGSGGGKICFIASQIVGPSGRVIGVDSNDEMLSLARKHQPTVAARIGFDNIEFRKAKIQDLRVDLERLDEYLAEHPVRNSGDWLQLQEYCLHMPPTIADGSVDVVVSNCVLNLVSTHDREQLFREIYRVVKPAGGRAVISDIVANKDVPESLQRDAQLWSGCISGAFREDRFVEAFERAGFYGIEIVARQAEPWAVVEGIEFRSLTVRAFKGDEGPHLERTRAVIYNGPWKQVIDDDGNTLPRGQRVAVTDKSFSMYGRAPYRVHITAIVPQTAHLAETLPTELPISGQCGESGCC